MTTSPPRDLADLREKASEATPGPWEADGDEVWRPSDVYGLTIATTSDDTGKPSANAHFIAAASPDRILALIEHAEALEAQVERVRALHYRCAATGPDPQPMAGYCHECVVKWPCPTILALAPQPAATEEGRNG